jgi:nitroimidazol reductase NimA-like FMN-containing flavoprotein (pyridoxamine 5'-phosphate oxidase superfamily)
MSDAAPSPRTRVRRRRERARYDSASIHAILDEARVGHVGFVQDGQPFVIPMVYGRDGDTLYLHGSAATRLLRSLGEGIPVSVGVTLVDGIVLARSAFHHSMNYRSVVLLGAARVVRDAGEQMRALRAIVEHVCPGRWDVARPPSDVEIAQTLVLALPIQEASAKCRSGPPLDAAEDMELDVWAGVVPLALVAGEPIPDPALRAGVETPPHASGYSR